MTETPKQIIIIPAGTELNNGPSEDSDSTTYETPIRVEIAGEEAEGAIPVRILGGDGQAEFRVRYFHQPPKTKANP